MILCSWWLIGGRGCLPLDPHQIPVLCILHKEWLGWWWWWWWGGQCYIFYYLYTHTYIHIYIYIYAYIYTHTYFCIFISVLEALQFYIALHIHSQHIHILHIFYTVLDMLDTIHMLDTLGTNYVATMLVQGINKPTQCVTPPWDAYLLIWSFLGTILRLRFLLKDFPGLDCV